MQSIGLLEKHNQYHDAHNVQSSGVFHVFSHFNVAYVFTLTEARRAMSLNLFEARSLSECLSVCCVCLSVSISHGSDQGRATFAVDLDLSSMLDSQCTEIALGQC